MSEDQRPAIDDIIGKLPTYLHALIGSSPVHDFGPLTVHTHSGTPGVISRYSIQGHYERDEGQITLEFSQGSTTSFALVLGIESDTVQSAEIKDLPINGRYQISSRVHQGLVRFIAEDLSHRDPGFSRALAKFTRVYLDTRVGEKVPIPV